MLTPRLSQVLLEDPDWIARCVEQVPSDSFGVEWASGRGALTRGLTSRWNYLLGLEKDWSFCRELRRLFPVDSVGILCSDILEYPLPRRGQSYPLVGNLPYHITGPLLIRILRVSDRIHVFRGLVQREVADRLTARPGDSSFGSISLLFQWMGTVEAVFTVPAGAFRPVPDVDSTWIRYRPERSTEHLESVRRLTRRCFRFPRKTLLNNLSDNSEQKSRWRTWMTDRGWDPRRRPGTLTPKDLEVLLEQWTNNGPW